MSHLTALGQAFDLSMGSRDSVQKRRAALDATIRSGTADLVEIEVLATQFQKRMSPEQDGSLIIFDEEAIAVAGLLAAQRTSFENSARSSLV